MSIISNRYLSDKLLVNNVVCVKSGLEFIRLAVSCDTAVLHSVTFQK